MGHFKILPQPDGTVWTIDLGDGLGLPYSTVAYDADLATYKELKDNGKDYHFDKASAMIKHKNDKSKDIKLKG